MRLQPIENPPGIFLKIAYRFSRKQFGKVLTPMKIIYARKPELLKFSLKITKFEEQQNSLSPEMRIFIKYAAAANNGCTFCTDIALAKAVKDKIGTAKFTALLDESSRAAFSEKERAVFNFIKEYADEKRTSDATFAALKLNFNDTEIVEILALNAFENFYNALNIPLEIESDGLRSLAEDSI